MLELKHLIIDELIRRDKSTTQDVSDYLLDLKLKKTSSDLIEDGSLVVLDCNGTKAMYFMTASHSASMLNIHEKVIMLVTPFSPLGMELIGKKNLEQFEINKRQYNIIAIY